MAFTNNLNQKQIAGLVVMLLALLATLLFTFSVLFKDSLIGVCTTDECCTKSLGGQAMFKQEAQQCVLLKEIYTRVERGNPATELCIQSGGIVKNGVTEEGDEYGTCIFLDGKECDQWDLADGKCS